jgi:SAM-dependent methyltransferase
MDRPAHRVPRGRRRRRPLYRSRFAKPYCQTVESLVKAWPSSTDRHRLLFRVDAENFAPRVRFGYHPRSRLRCPLPDACVDGIVLLNVLEHIQNDEAALFHVARILKPGGLVVIEVPAGPELFDVYDKLLLHHRRYRMTELLAKVDRAGLKILDRSHLGFFLYPLFRAVKKRGQRHLGESEDIQRSIVSRNINSGSSNPVLHALMRFEAAMRSRLNYKVGIRCLVTCQKGKAA